MRARRSEIIHSFTISAELKVIHKIVRIELRTIGDLLIIRKSTLFLCL